MTFPQQEEVPPEKKTAEYLYIDTDEDQVPLQFKEKKGDWRDHWKNKCVLAKLVYVYEGIEPESPRSKRNMLTNPHYFNGVYEAADNAKRWDEEIERILRRLLWKNYLPNEKSYGKIITVVKRAGLSEWQTRWTQNPLMATSCGFKSRSRHSLAGAPEGLYFLSFRVFF